MSTISYANIAANGSGSSSSSPSITKGELSLQTNPEINELNEKLQETKIESDESESKENLDEDKLKAKDKKLAPAPVPQTSAWGSTATIIPTDNDQVKWPTPPENYKSKPISNQKFIKPITNKWVPLDDAKVILPTARQNQTKNKNKNKKNKNKKPSSGNKKEKSDKSDKKEKVEKVEKSEKVEKLDKPTEKPVEKSGKSSEKVVNTPSPNSKKSEKDDTESSTTDSTIQSNVNEDKVDESNSNGFHQPQPYQMNYNTRQFRMPSNYRMNNRYSLPNNYNNGYMQMSYPPQHHQSLPINQYYPPPQQYQQQFQQYPYPNPYYQQNQQYQPPVVVPPPISPKQDPINALTQQLDYYFSLENLIKDIYLRKNFDNEGWINLSTILNFKRVQIIINNIKSLNLNKDLDTLIINSLNGCSNIEIENNDNELNTIKLRVKENYKQWILEN
ncbi:hypothetical protein CLIB1444_08S00958 [[Candida] jaroonii]|uniref:Uncharacterized protein n=1 Tax=[Candida] jaroonii TaxID=467808 RepID=A0ACA9YB52_9ASCO|nr:hypothetical protein CLIB1444_08S00958 [[Candida] jaroonii]